VYTTIITIVWEKSNTREECTTTAVQTWELYCTGGNHFLKWMKCFVMRTYLYFIYLCRPFRHGRLFRKEKKDHNFTFFITWLRVYKFSRTLPYEISRVYRDSIVPLYPARWIFLSFLFWFFRIVECNNCERTMATFTTTRTY